MKTSFTIDSETLLVAGVVGAFLWSLVAQDSAHFDQLWRGLEVTLWGVLVRRTSRR